MVDLNDTLASVQQNFAQNQAYQTQLSNLQTQNDAFSTAIDARNSASQAAARTADTIFQNIAENAEKAAK